MSSKRIFTDEELREMSGKTLDLVLEAIDAGDKNKAKELAKRMYKEFNFLHDGYFTWVTGLQTFIYKNLGIDALEKAEREAHTIEAHLVFKPSEKTDIRSRVLHMLAGMRGHLQPIIVEENDDTISITMQPCGSGARLINMGGYEAGLSRVKEPHRITFGQKDFPMYCVHCPVMAALDIENSGEFNFVLAVSDPIGKEGCHFTFYKDPAKIPEKYYTRIGKKKPVAKK
jgi:hypothetical protein